ncbi:MAG: hypothetical protein ACK43M_20375 [Allorhizobium sp.]
MIVAIISVLIRRQGGRLERNGSYRKTALSWGWRYYIAVATVLEGAKLLSVTDFIACLPGVKPKLARATILQGDILSEEERRSIVYRNAYIADDVRLVGPDAAAAILAAYQAGKLPMNKGAGVAEALRAGEYVNDEVVKEQFREYRRKEACLKDISLVKERDFSDNRLLDRIFFAHAPKGTWSLTLDGIVVTKDIRGYHTNSRKNTGYEVTFHWTGSNGQQRSSGTGKPPEASNRANDPKRSYGFHE